jgi:opacity protein-like surface antigen
MKAAFVLSAALLVQSALADETPRSAARSLYIAAGAMQPQADPRLTDQDGHPAFTAGIEWRYSRHVAFALDLLDTGQQADMPALERSRPGTPGARQREHINIGGIALGIRLIYPYGKLEPYLAGGIGYYGSQISDYGTLSHLVLPSSFAKRSDSDAGSHFALGLEYALSPASGLRLEYRRLRLQADFGAEFGGPVKIGGGIALLAYRGALR